MPTTMTRDEKKILIALCRYIMSSDGIITQEEIGKINQIAVEIGMDDYEELFNEVDNEITSIEDMYKKIDSLKNSKNLEKIIKYSIQMSRVDSNITSNEIEVLVYAADAWDLDIRALMNKC